MVSLMPQLAGVSSARAGEGESKSAPPSASTLTTLVENIITATVATDSQIVRSEFIIESE